MRKTVLIIDDDDDDRALFSDALREVDVDINCISAINGQEGVFFLKNEKTDLPDYIFLDLNMPKLNGIQCLAEIKKINRLKHIPVIIFSTTKRVEDILETKKLGAAYFFTKPALFEEICKAIVFILTNRWENQVPLQVIQ